jgi:hypothetical protein
LDPAKEYSSQKRIAAHDLRYRRGGRDRHPWTLSTTRSHLQLLGNLSMTTMPDIGLMFAWLSPAFLVVAFLVGYYCGEAYGMRTTEKRWDEAVARGEAERSRRKSMAE